MRPSLFSCRHVASPALALAAVSLLAGCVVGPDFAAPAPPPFTQVTTAPLPATTASSATTGGAAQHLDIGRDIEGEWWTIFHSPRIAALVAQAVQANPSITAAEATLREAKQPRKWSVNFGQHLNLGT